MSVSKIWLLADDSPCFRIFSTKEKMDIYARALLKANHLFDMNRKWFFEVHDKLDPSLSLDEIPAETLYDFFEMGYYLIPALDHELVPSYQKDLNNCWMTDETQIASFPPLSSQWRTPRIYERKEGIESSLRPLQRQDLTNSNSN